MQEVREMLFFSTSYSCIELTVYSLENDMASVHIGRTGSYLL